MESLAVILDPYRDLIASGAALITYAQQLSGVIICNDIRKKGSTKGMSVMPFIAGLVISAAMFIFGVLINDNTMLLVNAFGVAINITYVCFYYVYTNEMKEKTLVWAQLGYAGAFIAAITAYTFIEHPDVLLFRFGILVTVVVFYFVGSPLLGLGEIIKKKSTEGLPFPIILTGTLLSFMWLLYGIVARENFMVFQNAVLLVMSAIQLSLFAIYPSKPARTKPKKKAH